MDVNIALAISRVCAAAAVAPLHAFGASRGKRLTISAALMYHMSLETSPTCLLLAFYSSILLRKRLKSRQSQQLLIRPLFISCLIAFCRCIANDTYSEHQHCCLALIDMTHMHYGGASTMCIIRTKVTCNRCHSLQ